MQCTWLAEGEELATSQTCQVIMVQPTKSRVRKMLWDTEPPRRLVAIRITTKPATDSPASTAKKANTLAAMEPFEGGHFSHLQVMHNKKRRSASQARSMKGTHRHTVQAQGNTLAYTQYKQGHRNRRHTMQCLLKRSTQRIDRTVKHQNIKTSRAITYEQQGHSSHSTVIHT